MTAMELIDDILARHQDWMPADQRWITPAQRKYLLKLIQAGPEAAALEGATGGSLLWRPKGRRKFLIAECGVARDGSRKHKLTVLESAAGVECGSLF